MPLVNAPSKAGGLVISLDTETTGVDFYHGAKPFVVTSCDLEGTIRFWEWDVDPESRDPVIPKQDLHDLSELIEAAEKIVLQNSKFDSTALRTIGIELPWDRVEELLLMAHLLKSNRPKDLTSLGIDYLGENIEEHENHLKEIVEDARKWARAYRPTWRIAKKDESDMPSAKEKVWKFDSWLPKVVARELELDADDPMWTVSQKYFNVDAEITVALFPTMMEELKRRDLVKFYEPRKVLPSIAQRMETRGVTLSGERLEARIAEYKQESKDAAAICTNIAAQLDYKLELPKGASPNNNLKTFLYDHLHLPKILPKKSKAKSGPPNPTLDKAAMAEYLKTLPQGSTAHAFIHTLTGKRGFDTAVSYMESYQRFWLPTGIFNEKGQQLWYRLHPSLNITGTDTLRWSSKNPNEQNISAKEDFNIRWTFGPTPGRVWYSLDAKNIERRLPVFEANQEDIIQLFERPNEGPYYGSEHILVAHILHKQKFETCKGKDGKLDGRLFKDRFKPWYKKTKNGNFALQYQCGDETGDAAFGVEGACQTLRGRFTQLSALNTYWVDFAETHGYVETIPDRTIDPNKGYPLLCTRTEYGKVLPTVPLNFHIQGSAMHWMCKAMMRCEPVLEQWRAEEGFDGWLIMQVHDELVFDFPIDEDNEERVRILKELMEEGGNDYGIPTPVNCEMHLENWADSVTLAL